MEREGRIEVYIFSSVYAGETLFHCRSFNLERVFVIVCNDYSLPLSEDSIRVLGNNVHKDLFSNNAGRYWLFVVENNRGCFRERKCCSY